MFILDVQESYLVIHASVSFILDSFSYRLLQNVEQSSLRYSQGSCWLCVLYICVYLFIGMGALRGEELCGGQAGTRASRRVWSGRSPLFSHVGTHMAHLLRWERGRGFVMIQPMQQAPETYVWGRGQINQWLLLFVEGLEWRAVERTWKNQKLAWEVTCARHRGFCIYRDSAGELLWLLENH